MNILYITRVPPGVIGTNASYMLPLKSYEDGHDVTIVCQEAPEAEKELVVFELPQEIKVLNVESDYELQRVRRLTEVINEIKPDIIHVFMQLDAGWFPKYICDYLEYSPKWVCDIRSPLLAEKKAASRSRQSLPLLYSEFFDAITTHVEPSICTHLPIFSGKTQVVSLGVELSKFPERTNLSKKQIKRFVFCGVLAKMRKIDVLLELFIEALTQGEDVTLDIFGDGNAREALEEIVVKNEVQDKIKFRGLLEQNLLFKELSSFDCAIGYVPGGAYDKAPALKVLEYAAAGIQIIATNTYANRQLCKEGFELGLFEPSAESFVNVIRKLISQEDFADSIEKNLELVKKYDWNYIYEKSLRPLYENLLSENGKSRKNMVKSELVGAQEKLVFLHKVVPGTIGYGSAWIADYAYRDDTVQLEEIVCTYSNLSINIADSSREGRYHLHVMQKRRNNLEIIELLNSKISPNEECTIYIINRPYLGDLIALIKSEFPNVRVVVYLTTVFLGNNLDEQTDMQVAFDLADGIIAQSIPVLQTWYQNEIVPDEVINKSLEVYVRIGVLDENSESSGTIKNTNNVRESFKIISTGSISKKRDIENMLNVLELVNRQIPVTLTLCTTETALKEVINMDIPAFVDCIGTVQYDDLLSEISKYDALLAWLPLQSQYENAWSTKILEAAYVELPVIASDTFGHRDMIDKGFKIHLVENDLDTTLNAIRTIQKGANQGQKEIASYFSWKNIYPSIKNIWFDQSYVGS